VVAGVTRRCTPAEDRRTVVLHPEAEGGVQALTALQEDLLEVAAAPTQVRVVGADPRQAGLPVGVPTDRSRTRNVVIGPICS
jgi:hypothetical protein